MAVADIPTEQIVNVRSSWDQFLWELPGSGLYRWDKNVGYMYAYGAVPVPGQGLPPGPPIPNPEAPFSLGEVEYLNSIYVRTVNGFTPDSGGNVSITVTPEPPSGGWTAGDFTTAVRASLGLADTASQPGHTHTAVQISDATSTGQTLMTSADVAAARLALGAVASTRAFTAGTGLTGGGDLSADRSIALNLASIASLSKADTAVQPAALAAYLKTVNGVGPDANGNVTVTVEGGGYIKPAGGIPSTDMTAGVQTSLGRADSSSQPGHTHTASQISDSTTVGRLLLTAADAAAGRTALAAAPSATTITGAGSLTGGGDLNANRTLDLTTAAKTSLGKADTAMQPATSALWVAPTIASGYSALDSLAVIRDGKRRELRGGIKINTGNLALATGVITLDPTDWPSAYGKQTGTGVGATTVNLVISASTGSIDIAGVSGTTSYVYVSGMSWYVV